MKPCGPIMQLITASKRAIPVALANRDTDMTTTIQRYFVLLTGLTLTAIGLAYCIDPGLLLARYELGIDSVSHDNMYRGAYGGVFITIGLCIALGFRSEQHRAQATWLVLLIMGGFAIGRLASIAAVGLPHPQILSLLGFEIVSSVVCAYFLIAGQRVREA